MVWDREGHVSEIHVIATGERSAKMIARDIQSLLLVNHDLSVPYQKVSIVSPGRPPERPARAGAVRALRTAEPAETAAGPEALAAEEAEAAAPEEAAEPPALPGAAVQAPPSAAGWRLEGVQIRLLESRLEVVADLVSDSGERIQGRSAGPATPEGMAALGARAVVEAVAARREPAEWLQVHWVDLAGPLLSQAVVVALTRTERGRPREARWGLGVAPVQGNAAMAGALAALEALGKLLSRGGPAL